MTILAVGDFIMRPPVMDDLDAMVRMMEPAEMLRFLSPVASRIADSHARILRSVGSWQVFGYGNFTAWHRDSGILAATCGIFPTHRGLGADFDLMPEAGWIIAHEYWGQGLATALMTAVHDWFDATHGRQRTVAMIDDGHAASDRVAQKLGYRCYRTGHLLGSDTLLRLYERV